MLLGSFSLTDAAMAAVAASPTEFPSCEMVLKTPPANACESGGNARQITRLDTVHSTEDSQVSLKHGGFHCREWRHRYRSM